MTAIVQTTPFSPYDTSVYAGSGAANRWSPLPDTAHWAAASDLETLTGTGRFLRQLTLRSLTRGKRRCRRLRVRRARVLRGALPGPRGGYRLTGTG